MKIVPEEMIGIPIGDFITGSNIPVNVYIRLSDAKFIMIAKAGDQVELNQLQKYRDKNVDYLYVHNTDYMEVIDQGLRIAGVLLDHNELAHSKKVHVLGKMAKNVFDSFQKMKFTSDSFENAKQITSAAVKLVEAKPDLLALIRNIAESNSGAAAHAMATSATAVLIAKEMTWQNPAVIEKLALGGFLVDVGQKELPPEIAGKKRSELSHEELKTYESHPYRGAMLLNSLQIVPDDVVSIVYEHHENAIGQGFPRRLKDLTMHPLAKVVALANAFCELTFPAHEDDKVRTPEQAVQFLEQTMGQPFNKDAFKALKLIVDKSREEAA